MLNRFKKVTIYRVNNSKYYVRFRIIDMSIINGVDNNSIYNLIFNSLSICIGYNGENIKIYFVENYRVKYTNELYFNKDIIKYLLLNKIIENQENINEYSLVYKEILSVILNFIILHYEKYFYFVEKERYMIKNICESIIKKYTDEGNISGGEDIDFWNYNYENK